MTSESTSYPTSRPVTVCLVEDHRELRELLCDLLDNSGLQVLAAVGTMREGKETISEMQPDVAIIDNCLPDGRGIDLIRTISHVAPRVALVLHTGLATYGDAHEAFQAGASAVILKSIRGQGLIEAVRISHRFSQPDVVSFRNHDSQGPPRLDRSDTPVSRSRPSFRPHS